MLSIEGRYGLNERGRFSSVRKISFNLGLEKSSVLRFRFPSPPLLLFARELTL